MAPELSETQVDVHVLSTSQEQSLYVLRFNRRCGGPRCTQLHMTIEQITDCVRAPALIKNPSSIITHEDTDLRVGRSPAQSLSVNTVRVEHALFCTCRFSPRSCVPRRYRRTRFDAMRSDFEGFARDLARRFVANAMSGLRGTRN